MTIYFTDGYSISDTELSDIQSDPMAENTCIRCGVFANWGENDLCSDCLALYDNEASAPVFAETIGDMISMLEAYPLDTPLQDNFGNGYKICGFVGRLKNSANHDPGIILSHSFEDRPSTVMDLVSFLIDTSMDERFSGKDSKLIKYCISDNNRYTVMENTPEGPVFI